MQAPVMEGHGYYNAHSELQARSAAEADAALERALAAVAISHGPLTIADFGCSQGRNSMRPLALMLDRLAERAGPGRDMMVVHTDLPQCDFTSLFATLETGPIAIGAEGTMSSRLSSAAPFMSSCFRRTASHSVGQHSPFTG